MGKSIIGFILAVLLVGVTVVGCGHPASVAQSRNLAASPTLEPIPTGTPTETPAGGSWQVVQSLMYDFPINLAGFIDPDHGITVGYDGEVHYTTDGGQTWPRADNKSLCRFGLEIVDATTAWHCGNGGDIRISTDGGKSWQDASSFGDNEPNQCRYMSFLDAATGWAASPNKLGTTSDGGRTWTELSLPDGIQKITAIDLRSPSTGYLLDSAGNLFTTQDGGKTWSAGSLGLGSGESLYLDTAPPSAMRFVSTQQAVVVYTTKDLQLWSAWTSDGGKTWQREQLEKLGALLAIFLSRDGKILTITWTTKSKITVLHSLR
jgi:photosystem II stability/assembly factor-like uncharacterized protein